MLGISLRKNTIISPYFLVWKGTASTLCLSTKIPHQEVRRNCSIFRSVFWTERDFWIISDRRNSINDKLKNLWTKKISLTLKTESSSEESLKEKRHMFIGMCSFFTWLNMQIPNLRHVWHSLFVALSNI